MKERGKLLELVDPRLGVEYNHDEVLKMINVALLCTNVSRALRPHMSSVVQSLQTVVQTSNVPKNDDKADVSDGAWTTSTSTYQEDLYPLSMATTDSSETMSFIKPQY